MPVLGGTIRSWKEAQQNVTTLALTARLRACFVAPRFPVNPNNCLVPKEPEFFCKAGKGKQFMSAKKKFIGIDISKQLLEVAAHGSDYRVRCPNKESGFSELIAELVLLKPRRIVLEATGGLEIPVAAALYAVGLPVVVVNPR